MYTNKSFLITLGHNSSVIFYDGENSPIGYEEERLSGKKSDSSYPIKSINKIIEIVGEEYIKGSKVYISHWFDVFKTSEFPNKYFNFGHFHYDFVAKYSLIVKSVNDKFTHHDAHAYSGLAFLKYSTDEYMNMDMHHLVIDGFGNCGEVISLYKQKEGNLELIKRVTGYMNSLGLFYQYATSYCGMKENQDEYKFLGYESKIKYTLDKENIRLLDKLIEGNVNMFVNRIFLEENIFTNEKEIYLDVENLYKVRKYWYTIFDVVLNTVSEYQKGSDECRTVIGYFAQNVLEKVVLFFIRPYNVKNITCTGGCFMNVKLNNTILQNIQGKICVNPLCGDQGAAIGLYAYSNNNNFNFSDLCWGVRQMQYEYKIVQHALQNNPIDNVIFVSDEIEFKTILSNLLIGNNIVNVIKGNMEFGPRALCNTSTIAKPSKENVAYINKINNRNDVMPMAPVISESASRLFIDNNELDRVIGSNKFMIMAHTVENDFIIYNRGVCHIKPDLGTYTCRPQIINEDNYMYDVLDNTDCTCLINTSFNTHGTPILYSLNDVLQDFHKQKFLDNENRLKLLVFV